MNSSSRRETFLPDIVNQLDSLTPQQELDALLQDFLGLIREMDTQTARRMRDELSTRFGGRYCSQPLCASMIEMLNCHLGLVRR